MSEMLSSTPRATLTLLSWSLNVAHQVWTNYLFIRSPQPLLCLLLKLSANRLTNHISCEHKHINFLWIPHRSHFRHKNPTWRKGHWVHTMMHFYRIVRWPDNKGSERWVASLQYRLSSWRMLPLTSSTFHRQLRLYLSNDVADNVLQRLRKVPLIC